MNSDFIVKLPSLGGHGVLVGQFIITAAHCINYKNDASMVLGDYFIEEVQTCQGVIKVRPVAVEPVSDIAVLAALDDQEFGDEAEAFLDFCATTRPASLGRDTFPLRRPQSVKIHGHNGKWINGTASA